MDSFNLVQGVRFRERSAEPMGEAEDAEALGGFPGVLEVYVHHARNIHSICIYDDQDVYAKLSLTCRPEDALSTRVARGGGRNPEFHERLEFRVPHSDAVLKCEMRVLSRARDYMEDQLLGFALAPLSSIAAGGVRKTTEAYTLSSTDLFHTPAGTVRLTLSMTTSPPADPFDGAFSRAPSSSIASEVVLLNPVEYGTVEFPDITTARENQRMVSEYFSLAEGHGARSDPMRVERSPGTCVPFLHLGAASPFTEDYDMTANSCQESSPDNSSIQKSEAFGSTSSSLSEDRNSEGSAEKKNPDCAIRSHPAARWSSESPPETPTSNAAGVGSENGEPSLPICDGAEGAESSRSAGAMGEARSVFKPPLGSIDLEKEQRAMQQQIVDMYMRSMQQFTESLAKMKLPIDLDRPENEDGGDAVHIQSRSSNLDREGKKKDGSRVFYGSRAFF